MVTYLHVILGSVWH